jgi:hypothetical protein
MNRSFHSGTGSSSRNSRNFGPSCPVTQRNGTCEWPTRHLVVVTVLEANGGNGYRNNILPHRIPGAAVDHRKILDLDPERQTRQPVRVFGGYLFGGPPGRCSGPVVERLQA